VVGNVVSNGVGGDFYRVVEPDTEFIITALIPGVVARVGVPAFIGDVD
jgi:hypothetical protein